MPGDLGDLISPVGWQIGELSGGVIRDNTFIFGSPVGGGRDEKRETVCRNLKDLEGIYFVSVIADSSLHPCHSAE